MNILKSEIARWIYYLPLSIGSWALGSLLFYFIAHFRDSPLFGNLLYDLVGTAFGVFVSLCIADYLAPQKAKKRALRILIIVEGLFVLLTLISFKDNPIPHTIGNLIALGYLGYVFFNKGAMREMGIGSDSAPSA